MSTKNRFEKKAKIEEEQNKKKLNKEPIEKKQKDVDSKKQSETSLLSLTLGIVLCYITLFVVNRYFIAPKKSSVNETVKIETFSKPFNNFNNEISSSILTDAIKNGAFSNGWAPLPDYASTQSLDNFGSLPLWGSYRPGFYIGMKTRANYIAESNSIQTPRGAGFTWFASDFSEGLREKTAQDDIKSFEWKRHDGKNYGEQVLNDEKLSLSLNDQFIALSSDQQINNQISWSKKIEVNKKSSANLSYLFSYGSDCSDSKIKDRCLSENLFSSMELIQETDNSFYLVGSSKSTGLFALKIFIEDKQIEKDNPIVTSYGGFENVFLSKISSDIYNELKAKNKKNGVYSKNKVLINSFKETSTLFAFLIQTDKEFILNIDFFENLSFESIQELKNFISEGGLKFDFNNAAKPFIENFDLKFDNFVKSTYKEDSQDDYFSLSSSQLNQIKSTLSSLIGGIGQYEGIPRIDFSTSNPLDNIPWKQQEGNSSARLSLFTASPSRAVFPRGFLWDEGFHQMILSQFDVSLSLRIITDWFNTMFFLSSNSTFSSNGVESLIGWIPREIILGEDPSSRVPDEFITQKVTIANPPTFILVINNLLDRYLNPNNLSMKVIPLTKNEKELFSQFLNNVYPRLHAWIQWYRITQQNDQSSPSFRWRGRANDGNQYIPNTLASGLDDYPRGYIATSNEKHLDLYCWIAKSYKIMDRISNVLNDLHLKNEIQLSQDTLEILPFALGLKTNINIDKSVNQFVSYSHSFNLLQDSLIKTHYDTENKNFFDIGFYSDELPNVDAYVSIVCSKDSSRKGKDTVHNISQKLFNSIQNGKENPAKLCPAEFPQPIKLVTDPWGHPQIKMITNHPKPLKSYEEGKGYKFGFIPRLGYNSLFPLLMKLLPLESNELSSILTILENKDLLMTDGYGLRSISKQDIFYNQESALYNEPYWRGLIWIPINYLATSSLNYYSTLSLEEIKDEKLELAKSNKQRALLLYTKLRRDIVVNVLKEHERTDNTWEQYDDNNGQGKRGHPFTGWTASIINIYFELSI